MAIDFDEISLNEVAHVTDFVANGSFASLKENVTYKNVPDYAVLVRTVDFNNSWNGNFVWVDKRGFDFLSKSRLEIGDLVLSNVGSVGIVFRVPNLGQPMTLGPNAVMCRTRNSNRLDQGFLYYYFTSSVGQNALRSITSGSVQSKFNKTDFRALKLSIPSPSEQKRIAHILGTLDDKIELNRKLNATLEAMARALFKSWFVDFDPVRAKMEGRQPEGMDAETSALFPGGFEESELGEIPMGWTVGSLGDVAEHPRRGIQPDAIESGTPYIALEHMPRRCIALSEWDTSDELESNKFEFKKGEILFGKLRPYFHKVGIAPVNGVCSTDIVDIAPCKPAWFGFVLGHVSSDQFVEYTNAGSTGTKMPRTSWADMARYEIALPPKPIVEIYTEALRPLTDQILANIHQSRTLVALRNFLIPHLLADKFDQNS